MPLVAAAGRYTYDVSAHPDFIWKLRGDRSCTISSFSNRVPKRSGLTDSTGPACVNGDKWV